MKALRGKVAARQFQRDYAAQNPPQVEIAFLLQDWDDAYNVGGLFRVADAVGAKLVALSGKTPAPPDPMIAVPSMGHHRRLPWFQTDRHDQAADRLESEGWSLVAVELADGSVPYHELVYPAKTCLVLGNEVNGVYPGLLKRCDAAVFLPMRGKGKSMNVHVSGAIVAYHATTVGRIA
jgi:tRNA (guanosine-2'-O-)-methyltransferase